MTHRELPPHPISPPVWLIGGGEMGKLILAMDWSQTPLGPIESWPASLRTTVSFVLNSNFPICMAWGHHDTLIYNDGYRPMIGDKHPSLLGSSFKVSWPAVWSMIGTAFVRAREGAATFFEDNCLFLDRRGYLEEGFFTFSFSPVCDETGDIAGVLCPVIETTGNMLGQRRIRTLRDISALATSTLTIGDVLQCVAKTLGASELDVPFALFYVVSEDGNTATLVAQTGLSPGAPASPITVDLTQTSSGWPFASVVATHEAVLLQDLRERFEALVCGPYSEPIQSALVQPILLPGNNQLSCIMVTGISTRLPMTEAYRSFFDLLAASVATIVANAAAFATERKRADALAEIDDAKTAFFSNISHEFRTPLTLLLGPLEGELAEHSSPLPPSRRTRLEIAHRNGLRLLKLVNTLLDFARIEAGRAHANYEPTDLAALTTDLASNFRSICEHAGLQFLVDCPPLPQLVYVDRDMWEKIVLNLLSNAFKFTLTGGIAIGLKAIGDRVELTVRDTGVGIAANELPRVFERFHRFKGGAGRTHEGMNIGLALVKKMVELHGGSISAASVLGQGSAFSVTIPFGVAQLLAHGASATRDEESTSVGARPFVEEALRWLPASNTVPHPAQAVRRPRIVWADDNADMRDYVRSLLGEKYEVEAVADGEAALAAIRREPPTLVLSDIMMPKLDGLGLLRELRADENLRTIPVILLSARAGEEAYIEGLETGADDYLVKPFVARVLLSRVDAHVELAQLRLINERRQIDDVLRESERDFRQLAEAIPQLVWIADAEGRGIFFNKQWEQYTGLNLDKSYDEDWGALIHPEDRTLAWGNWLQAIKTGGKYAAECRLRSADGAYRWWLIRGVPVTDSKGAAQKWFGACTDIDSIKRAEQALFTSEQRARTIIETDPECIKIVNRNGELVEMNAAGLAMLEANSVADVQQAGLAHFILAEYQEAFVALHQRVMNGESGTLQFEVMGLKGTRRWLETHVAPLRDTTGEIIQLLSVARDITANKLADAKIRAQLDELLRWQQATLGREDRVQALKREVNTLLVQMGQPIRYPSQTTT